MTRRQRLEAVINGEITEELIESCKNELAKMDVEKELTPNQRENERVGELILELLRDGSHKQVDLLMAELGTKMARQRITAICTELIRDGKLKSEDVSVSGKGKRKAYYI